MFPLSSVYVLESSFPYELASASDRSDSAEAACSLEKHVTTVGDKREPEINNQFPFHIFCPLIFWWASDRHMVYPFIYNIIKATLIVNSSRLDIVKYPFQK